jgi:hypothetical protein
VHMVQGDKEVECSIDIRFTGEQIRLYGGRAMKFGLASVTIDGGDERIIDLATLEDRERENMLLYTSPILPVGEHTVTIVPKFRDQTVESKTYPKATGAPQSFGFSLDRVKVMDGKADLEAEAILVEAVSVTDKLVLHSVR